MTFTLLARDPVTGALGGASATGNLCVGAWVLRGAPGVGLSASQGHYPSTLWGTAALQEMAHGSPAATAIENVVAPDPGRGSRQLLALGPDGTGAVFSGPANLPAVSECIRPGICAAGNMLSGPEVVEALVAGYTAFEGSFLRRLIAGLKTAADQGGDARGLMSAAVLIVAEDHPPLDLRVDLAEHPLTALSDLARRVEDPDYSRWMAALPTTQRPFSAP